MLSYMPLKILWGLFGPPIGGCFISFWKLTRPTEHCIMYSEKGTTIKGRATIMMLWHYRADFLSFIPVNAMKKKWKEKETVLRCVLKVQTEHGAIQKRRHTSEGLGALIITNDIVKEVHE